MRKLTIIVLASLLVAGCWETENGQKSGVLVKVTKQGMYWGTYEGELVRGGFDDGSGANGKAFDFSFGAFESSLVKQAREYMQKGHPVTIYYKCEAWVASWRGGHNCFVYKIINHEKGKK